MRVLDDVIGRRRRDRDCPAGRRWAVIRRGRRGVVRRRRWSIGRLRRIVVRGRRVVVVRRVVIRRRVDDGWRDREWKEGPNEGPEERTADKVVVIVGPLLTGPLIPRPLTTRRLLDHRRAAVGGAPTHRHAVSAATTTPTHRHAAAPALGLGDARREQDAHEERAGGDDRRKLLANHHFPSGTKCAPEEAAPSSAARVPASVIQHGVMSRYHCPKSPVVEREPAAPAIRIPLFLRRWNNLPLG